MNAEVQLVRKILRTLAPHSILVGSAAKRDSVGDIDLVVSRSGLAAAKRVMPGWTSMIFGHVRVETEIPIEVFRYWYGPSYSELVRRKDLTQRRLCGVMFRAWPHHIDTRTKGQRHYKPADGHE